jgi:hypothetical protein
MRWWLLVLAGCRFQAGSSANTDASGGIADVPPPIDAAVTFDAPIDVAIAPTPIVFVQGNSAQSGMGATTVLAAYPGAQGAGDLNVVVVSWLGPSTVATIADVALNTYISLGTSTNGTISQELYYAQDIHAAVANTNTVTVTFAQPVNSPTIRLVEYSGIAGVALDAVATSSGTSDAANSGLVATTHAHDLVYAEDTNTNTTIGPGPMFVQRMIFSGDIVEDREVLTSGSYSATAPLNQTSDWIMVIAAFKGVP